MLPRILFGNFQKCCRPVYAFFSSSAKAPITEPDIHFTKVNFFKSILSLIAFCEIDMGYKIFMHSLSSVRSTDDKCCFPVVYFYYFFNDQV